jgi:phosphonate degradation associated HDIG domain protein
MSLAIEQIIQLYRTAGAARYGREQINQEQHALQCASLAQCAGAGAELVAAALLHDLGHLLNAGAPESDSGKDDLHEYRAIPFLRGRFGNGVIEPVRLHVEAKRWLCATDPAYERGLSPASRHSLELQGGAFTEAEAADFLAEPFAAEAVQLCRWDDHARSPTRVTQGWVHFEPVLRRACLRESLGAFA